MGQQPSVPEDSPRTLALGDKFPDFKAVCTRTKSTPQGTIHWHDYIEGSWAILFSHPAAYTPICTLELGMMAKLADDFEFRGVKICGLSCDEIKTMEGGWREDIEHLSGARVKFPIIADTKRTIAVQLGMLDNSVKDADDHPLPVRAVYIIGPDKLLKLSILCKLKRK
jgi:1-Cys peroxiredoxin 6